MKSILSLLTISSLFLFVTSYVSAQSAEDRVQQLEERQQERMERIEGRQERISQTVENRCELLTGRIENRINRFNTLKDERTERYNNVLDRLAIINEKLQNEGYDTSEVEANWQTMNGLVQNYSVAYQEFIAALEDTKQYACGESEGAFRDELDQAQEELKDVRDIGFEIRSFYINTLKPSVIALRNQDPSQE